jgi:hypothetical protein
VCAGDDDQDGWTDLFASRNAHLISAEDPWRLLHNAPNPMSCDPQDPACTPRTKRSPVDDTGGLAAWPLLPPHWPAARPSASDDVQHQRAQRRQDVVGHDPLALGRRVDQVGPHEARHAG